MDKSSPPMTMTMTRVVYIIVHIYIKVYNNCYHANLYGPHDTPSTPGVSSTDARLTWNDNNWNKDVSSSEMKIRVKGCVMPPTDSC